MVSNPYTPPGSAADHTKAVESRLRVFIRRAVVAVGYSSYSLAIVMLLHEFGNEIWPFLLLFGYATILPFTVCLTLLVKFEFDTTAALVISFIATSFFVIGLLYTVGYLRSEMLSRKGQK